MSERMTFRDETKGKLVSSENATIDFKILLYFTVCIS
jgi:hypothetical protein